MIDWLLLHGLEVIFVTAAVAGFSLGMLVTILWVLRSIMSGLLRVQEEASDTIESPILKIAAK